MEMIYSSGYGKMNVKEKEPCYGCNHIKVCPINNQREKGYPIEGRYSDCPCSKCLVKSMCHTICNKFSFHYGKIFGLGNMDALDVFYHT